MLNTKIGVFRRQYRNSYIEQVWIDVKMSQCEIFNVQFYKFWNSRWANQKYFLETFPAKLDLFFSWFVTNVVSLPRNLKGHGCLYVVWTEIIYTLYLINQKIFSVRHLFCSAGFPNPENRDILATDLDFTTRWIKIRKQILCF